MNRIYENELLKSLIIRLIKCLSTVTNSKGEVIGKMKVQINMITNKELRNIREEIIGTDKKIKSYGKENHLSQHFEMRINMEKIVNKGNEISNIRKSSNLVRIIEIPQIFFKMKESSRITKLWILLILIKSITTLVFIKKKLVLT